MAFVLASAAGLAGCLTPTITVTAVAPPPHPLSARAVDEVRVVRPPEKTNGTDIYLIEVSSGSLFRREPMLRAKAAELGCDAVRITSSGEPSRGKQVATGQLNSHMDDAPPSIIGACVVFPIASK